jgi:hypothetical protein
LVRLSCFVPFTRVPSVRTSAHCSICLLVACAAAFPGIAQAGDDAVRSAHVPKIDPIPKVTPAISDGSGTIYPILRSGRVARIRFSAEDSDGGALTYAVAPLPEGATLDAQRGVLTWQPTRNQEGTHEVTLEVSDGQLTAEHTFTFLVRPNLAPMDHGNDTVTYLVARAARQAPIYLAADPDADDITCEVRKGPREGHVVVARGSATYVWSPIETDIGEHELVVDVSDGELRTTVHRTIVVMPEWEARDYRRWFLLGGGPSAFLSQGEGEAFLGGTLDITLVALREDGRSGYACAHGTQRDECHASHHRFYGQFEVLDSMRSGAASLFTYGAGYSASLEWKPGRRYLIPHYGIDAGGLVRSRVGHRVQVHPYLGLHLWASDSLWLDATLGYRVTPAELQELSGPTLALRAILNAW